MNFAAIVKPATPGTLMLAGIDIGTLTCRLLIARLTGSGILKEVYAERRMLRLGQDVDRDRSLRVDAMDRVLGTLREWRAVIDTHQVDATTAVATSAIRDAANRQEFLDRVKREAGFEVEVITGEEEARRTMLGIRSGLPSGVARMLALDIGGGSTEFILDHTGGAPLIRSINIGVVRLTERLLAHDPPTTEEVKSARELVRQETSKALKEIGHLQNATFVGTAGTVTTLAAMAQRLPAYEPTRVHNYWLKLSTITDLERELLGRTKAQRQGLPGLERGREDVIVAGTIILQTVMETLEYSECLVSDLGLREGVLLDLAQCLHNRLA